MPNNSTFPQRLQSPVWLCEDPSELAAAEYGGEKPCSYFLSGRVLLASGSPDLAQYQAQPASSSCNRGGLKYATNRKLCLHCEALMVHC